MPEATADPANKLPEELVLSDPDQYYSHLLYAIATAQRTIDLEAYIFTNDPLGRRIVEALCKAAQSGVRTRLIVDGFGTDTDFAPLAQCMRKAGVQVRIFHPLPWRLSQWPYALSQQPYWRRFWHFLSFLNQRNHRKMLLVDHQTCIVGSFNLSQKHLSCRAGGENWRDSAVQISGRSHSSVRIAFEAVWRHWNRRWRKGMAKRFREDAYLHNFTRSLRLNKRKRILGLLSHAQQRIWLTNAYFVPDPLLLKTLIAASQRGVDVCLLLPRRSDVPFIPWTSRYFYEQLLQAGCRIYEYQAGILHAKTLVIDQQAIVGSSNLNRRSFFHDLELDYLSEHPQTLRSLEELFAADLTHSERMEESQLRNRGRLQRLLGFLVLLLFAYWV